MRRPARTSPVVRASLLLAAAAAVAAAVAPPARAASGRLFAPGSLVVVIDVEPSPTPPRFAASSAFGVGVYPGSRSAEDFLAQVGSGAPTKDVSSVEPGRPFALARALSPTVRISASGRLASLLVYGGPFAPGSREVGPADPALVVVEGSDPAAVHANMVVRIPADGRTPLSIEARTSAAGLLAGGQSRRAGVVTPYDLSATLLEHFGIARPSGFVGRALHLEPRARPAAAADAIARRMVRDAATPQSLTAWTVVLGLGPGWPLGFVVVWAGRRARAGRLTAASSMVTAGFLAALFVPAARGDVRALPVFAAFAIGLLVPPARRVDTAMRVFASVSVATIVLAVVAAGRPGGSVAAALWGDPLVSWRFFGLQNFETAFVAGGIVVGATALGVSAAALAALSVAGLVAVGSAHIGANFVAVLTFAFGASFAVVTLARKRMRPATIALAAGVALVAFAIALASDAGSAGSHGGAAAREIGRGGVSAAWDLALDRLRLNVRAVNAFPGGWAWVALFAGLYTAMIRDGFARTDWTLARRAAIVGGCLAGAAALALEDSGFKTTAVLGFPALMLWSFLRAGEVRVGRRRAPSGAEPATPPPQSR